MADEQTPPKRDVNEVFTLDVSEPTADFDGPLAHLMSSSAVSDLAGPWSDPDSPGDVDNSSNLDDADSSDPDDEPSHLAVDDGPEPEPFYTITADLAEEDRPTIPTRVGDADASTSDNGDESSVDASVAALDRSWTQPIVPVGDERPRPLVGNGNLRFSTEPDPRFVLGTSDAERNGVYPATLVPNAIPAPVAPNRSVRVPGEERRHGTVSDLLIDLTDRRWFLGAVAAAVGIVAAGLVAAANLIPIPFASERADIVGGVPIAVTSTDDTTETSVADDTASSTGASSGVGPVELDPEQPASSAPPETFSTSATTSRPRRPRTTAPVITARPTTTIVSTTTESTIDSTSTSDSTSTTDSSTSSTDTTTSSSTTDPDDTTPTSDTSSSSTPSSDTTESTGTTAGSGGGESTTTP